MYNRQHVRVIEVKVINESDVKPTDFIFQQTIILWQQILKLSQQNEMGHIPPVQEPPRMATRNACQNKAQAFPCVANSCIFNDFGCARSLSLLCV